MQPPKVSNERVLHIPQSSTIWASQSNGLLSNPGPLLEGNDLTIKM